MAMAMAAATGALASQPVSSSSAFFRGASTSTSAAWRATPQRVTATASSFPDALLLDCDGVLVDTERDGHRVCFNKAFAEKGVGVHWTADYFGTILGLGIGKRRIANYFDLVGWPGTIPRLEREAVVAALHRRKTDLFIELVESGSLPLRPGVRTLIDEALARDIPVAVCSTSLERAVRAIVRMLGREMRVFAGDVVKEKKPHPAVYHLAAKTLGVRPERCVVIEDSRVGLQAAKAAGMACIVTTSAYTANEDFAIADAVFPCIGEHFDLAFAGSLLRETDLVA